MYKVFRDLLVGTKRAQAWVTSAVSNEHVAGALVLAESIRKTGTNYNIAVVTSLLVSRENR